MKKIRQKVTSVLLIVFLLTALMPQVAFAAEPIGVGPVKIHLDFLGKMDQATHSMPGSATAIPTLEVGDVFWVGVRATNLTKDTYQVLENYGFQQWQMSFNYDTQYIKPYTSWDFDAGEETSIASDGFRSAISKANIASTYDNTRDLWSKRYQVDTDTTDVDMDLNNVYAEPSILSASATTRLLSMKINIPDSRPVSEQRFYQANDPNAEYYLFKFPMQIQSVPAEGKDVFEMALTAETFTVVFSNPDATNEEWTGCWVDRDGIKTDQQNLKKRLQIVDRTLNIFPKQLNLTYHDNTPPGASIASGSVEGQTQQVTEGKSVKESAPAGDGEMLAAPKIAGYVFKGWFTNQSGGTEVTKDTKINSDMDLYARWEEGYAITFNPNRGKINGETKTVVKELGKTATIALGDVPANATVTRDEYTFAGWNTKANGTGTTLPDPSAVVAHNFNATSTTLYAQWTAAGTDRVTITFNGNGATTGPNPASITLNKGDTIDTGIPDVGRTNYKFKEWNTKQNGTGTKIDKYSTIDSTQTVYAQWLPEGGPNDKVTVNFVDDGNTHANPQSIAIRKNDSIGDGNMPDVPTKNQATFDKWIVDTDKNGTIDNGETTEFTGSTSVTESIQVVAKWRADVNVTFHVRDGKIDGQVGDTKVISLKPGQSLTAASKALPTATSNKEGYNFWGWKTKDNGGGTTFDADTVVDDNIDVYAVFQKATVGTGPSDPPVPGENAIKVVFDKNGGDSDADPKEWYIDKNNKFSDIFGAFPTDPKKTNYVFKSWNTKKNGMGTEATMENTPLELLTDKSATELVLYAQWDVDPTTPDENKVKIDFMWNDNDPSHSAPYRTINLFKGDKLTADMLPDAPERAGYAFSKWVYNVGGADFDPEAQVNENTVVNASWSEKVTVTFYRNDNNAQPDATKLHEKVLVKGEEFKATDIPQAPAERAGYRFVRWEKSDGSAFTGGNIAEDTKVYAQWARLVTFTFSNPEVMYNGQVQKLAAPTVTADSDGSPVVLDSSLYEITYKLDGTPSTPQAAGRYQVERTIKDNNSTADTYEVTTMVPAFFTITKKPLKFKVEGDQVVKTDGKTATAINISKVTSDPTPAYTVKYALWTDTDKDGKISDGELGAATATAPSAYGKYVVSIELGDNANYVFDDAGWVEGDTYGADDYTSGTAPAAGTNIKWELRPSAALTGLAVKDNATSDPVQLYKNPKDTWEDGDKTDFADDTTDYYVSVKDGQKIKVELAGTLPDDATVVEVKLGDNKVEITGDDNAKATGALDLAPLDPNAAGAADRFNNKLTIKVGDKTYTLHIRQLLKPQIKLNYGNSPYGEIMKMSWDDAKKQRAKEEFNRNYRFASDLLPDNLSELVRYTPNAWGNLNAMTEVAPGTDLEEWKVQHSGQIPFINYDKDPTAAIIFLRTNFVDPGLRVYDSLGQSVNLSEQEKVVRTIKFEVMTKAGVDGFTKDLESVQSVTQMKGSAEDNFVDLSDKRLKPGVYTIEYAFVDKQGCDVKVSRSLVSLVRLGDVTMDTITNSADATAISKSLKKQLPSESTVGSEWQGRLYRYRVADVNKDTIVNSADATAISKDLKKKIVQFYKLISQ